MSEPPPRVAVGRVTRAHGIHGYVQVLPLTDVPERFEPGSRLLLGPTGMRTVAVAERGGTASRPLIRFEGFPDRSAAEAIAGEYLFVDASESPRLPDGQFWPHELIGLGVVTASGTALGTLQEVLRTMANDIWVAVDDAGVETLVPALRDVILTVDVAAGRVTVADVPGLTVPGTPAG